MPLIICNLSSSIFLPLYIILAQTQLLYEICNKEYALSSQYVCFLSLLLILSTSAEVVIITSLKNTSHFQYFPTILFLKLILNLLGACFQWTSLNHDYQNFFCLLIKKGFLCLFFFWRGGGGHKQWIYSKYYMLVLWEMCMLSFLKTLTITKKTRSTQLILVYWYRWRNNICKGVLCHLQAHMI